ncbi:hypothetical protein D3C78_1616580 [compost metagenome]
MPERLEATWASRERSTISARAMLKQAPWPRPSTTAHSQMPESGAYSRPSRPARVSTITTTTPTRWSRPRVASHGAASALPSCTITEPESTSPAAVGVRPRSMSIDGSQPNTI